MSLRTMNFDAIAASAPLNREASVVRDGSGDLWEARIPVTTARWIAPPPMKRMSDLSPIGRQMLREMAGRRAGRMIVLGIWADSNPKKNASWVCRCGCGYYEARKAKAINAERDDELCCSACQALNDLRRAGRSASTPASRAREAARLSEIADKGSVRAGLTMRGEQPASGPQSSAR